MSKTRRHDPRNDEGHDEVKAFYTRVRPVRKDEDYYYSDDKAPANVVAFRPRQIRKQNRSMR